MALRVVEVERRSLAGDEADQALMRAQHGAVHGVAIKALGGVEFERIVDPQDVDRAHLRHHVGGDQHHDLVQTFLRGDLLRHGFAKPSQQDAGTSRRASHLFKSSPTRPAYRARPGAGVKLKTQQIYSFGSVYRPNHTAKTVAQFTIGLIFRPYTELNLVLPSKRPASVTVQKSVHSG